MTKTNFDPVKCRIFEGITGSQLYGTNTPESDTDYRGVCIPPFEILLDPFQGFDQKDAGFEEEDRTIYALGKFIKLCADANPNIIELLFIPENKTIMKTWKWDAILANKNMFLSKKIRYTFSGYAFSQLKAIKTHRQYFLNPPKEKPTRKMFGLTDAPIISGDNLAFLSNIQRDLFKEEYAKEINNEVNYRKAKQDWDNFVSWRDNRNPARMELENKYGYDCYDDESTEFLTVHGWKKYDQISINDLLATVNIKTHELEFQEYKNRTDKLYSGLMYLIDLRSSRCLVTPNHNLLVSPCHRKLANNFSILYEDISSDWHLQSINNILENRRSHFHIIKSPSIRAEEYPVEDEYLLLAGLYISEGSTTFRNDKVKCIRFTQKKDGIFVKIANELMNKYPIKMYDGKKEVSWVLHGDIAKKIHNDFGHKDKKTLPNWCLLLSTRQVEILWKSLMAGDGYDSGKRNIYYTTLFSLGSQIQAMLVCSGLSSSMYGPFQSFSQFKNDPKIYESNMYQIIRSNMSDRFHCLSFSKILPFDKLPSDKKDGYAVKERMVENRRVVCFEVPNGTLITRNGGKVAIHGNCKHASHLARLLMEAEGLLLTGTVEFPLPYADEILAIRNGKYDYDEIVGKAETSDIFFDELYDRSTLPHAPDRNGLTELYLDIISK